MHTSIYRPSAAISVTGADAATFLQGQFTNELRQDSGAAVYGLWLNQKGKVLADSTVLKLAENEFQVVSLTSPAAVIQARLEEYIIADEVTLADETAQVRGLTLAGGQAGEHLRRILGAVPAKGRFVSTDGLRVFGGRRTREENYELIGPEGLITDTKQKLLAAGAREAGPGEMDFIRIEAGLPVIPQEIGPADLPNEGGLENTAISYTKGCYLGQEVMARLKNLGQVRRRLHVVRGVGVLPAVSAALYQAGKKVGQVRSTAAKGNEFVAFAMLSLVNLDQAAGLSLAPDAEPTMKIMPHE